MVKTVETNRRGFFGYTIFQGNLQDNYDVGGPQRKDTQEAMAKTPMTYGHGSKTMAHLDGGS